VPFVRFSRDKRGYEHVYLVEPPKGRGGHAQILYWFRTPPGIKVGREAFDAAARHALESQYPGVRFDWERIVNTPMPPPDAQHWRERRLAERAAKRARTAEETAPESPESLDPEVDAQAAPDAPSADQVAAAAGAAPDGPPAAEQDRRRRRRRGRRGRNHPAEGAGPRATEIVAETGTGTPGADHEASPVVSGGEDL